MTTTWSAVERAAALRAAEGQGVDLLVIGGGITGAGVLRDAASRGLRALLVEREDFAAGTSSRSSKLVHGGLRYLAEGQLGLTREAVRERDQLLRQHPNLIRPMPFLLPAWTESRLPLWKVRAALLLYAGLAGFGREVRGGMLDPRATLARCPALRAEGLLGAGLYRDGQVDDARLVLETLKSARRLGAEAVSYAAVEELMREAGGRVCGARVRDAHTGRVHPVRAAAVVNAAGPAAGRVLGMARAEPVALRPAKGVHLVVPRERLPTSCAVTFEAADGRHLFFVPWDEEVGLVGTTDSFDAEIDEPVVRIEEVHYLLEAANRAFPRAALTTNDVRCAFAGVRPLVAEQAGGALPPSSVSREERVECGPPGLVSVWGGKLTTYRATAERVVDRVVAGLPRARRRSLGRSRTAGLALREDDFDGDAHAERLSRRYDLPRRVTRQLVRAHGPEAEALLAVAEPDELAPIGRSAFCYAQVAWSLRAECALGLCDVLERRVRLAVFAPGQGLGQLERLVAVAARAAGWDDARARSEAAAYVASVRRRYQIASPDAADAA